MNRFPRRRPYDYGYGLADGRSAWDSHTFVGIDSSEGIDGEEDDVRVSRFRRASHRRPSASVIGIGDYGDFDGLDGGTRPRRSLSDIDDDGSSVEDPDLGPYNNGRLLDKYSRQEGLVRHDSGVADLDSGLDDSLGRTWPPPPPNTHVNIDMMLPAPPPTVPDVPPLTSSHRSIPVRSRPGHGQLVPRSVPASPPSGTGVPLLPPPPPPSGGASGYYHHERHSLSDPRLGTRWGSPPRELGWKSRPASRSASREREYPLQRISLRPQAHHHHGLLAGDIGDVREEDLRARLGGVEKDRLVNPRLPSTNGQQQQNGFRRRSRRRSESYDRFGNGIGGETAAGGRASSHHRPPHPQYTQVHALILTWAFHDLRAEDYTAPPAEDYVSLEEETARLRATLEGYGYVVHEFLIPMHRSLESLKAELKQFLRYAADDTLLIVYYHGHGALDEGNELIFSSHDHPKDAEWAKAAAAELYAALLTGDACHAHGRPDRYQELLKKYERYRPVSSIKWTSIRNPILSAPCDVLLILDCCAAGAAGLPSQEELDEYANANGTSNTNGTSRPYTKHLFAACGFESSTSDYMTTALCEVLGEWIPPASLPPAASSSSLPESSRSRSRSGSRSHSRSRSRTRPQSQSRPTSRAQTPTRSKSQPRSQSRPRLADAEADSPPSHNHTSSSNAHPTGVNNITHHYLTTKRLHQLMEHKLQKRSVGSQPIFKQLLPLDPEQYVTLPNLRKWREAWSLTTRASSSSSSAQQDLVLRNGGDVNADVSVNVDGLAERMGRGRGRGRRGYGRS
ncbi:hypothetical protein VTJ49DRAFT_2278 [Mycothermus thermophilus]|uniref:Uncharacterized protein n=1 Tax=Humicola insolens TaxID=85995 RepID=A0ABR3VC05_HUMIN